AEAGRSCSRGARRYWRTLGACRGARSGFPGADGAVSTDGRRIPPCDPQTSERAGLRRSQEAAIALWERALALGAAAWGGDFPRRRLPPARASLLRVSTKATKGSL